MHNFYLPIQLAEWIVVAGSVQDHCVHHHKRYYRNLQKHFDENLLIQTDHCCSNIVHQNRPGITIVEDAKP